MRYKWKPSKAKIAEFKKQMTAIEEYCKENNIQSSLSNDSYYFRHNGKKYRISNHKAHEGNSDIDFYIHASKTRLIEIHKAIINGESVEKMTPAKKYKKRDYQAEAQLRRNLLGVDFS